MDVQKCGVLTSLFDLQIDVGKGRRAIIIFVPVPQLKQFHKIQQRFVKFLF
jgi:hypothetical protein